MKLISAPPDGAQILPLQQHSFYTRALALVGTYAENMSVVDGADVLADLVIIHRQAPVIGAISLTVRGPVMRPEHGARDVLPALRDLTMIEAVGGQKPALRSAKFRQMMTPTAVAILDLTGDRRGRMKGKWRNRLVKAENERLKIIETALPDDPNHWLIRAEAAQRRAKRYRGLPPQFASVYAVANPGQARLFEARAHGETVAAMLFLQHGKMATYQIGWANAEGRLLNASNLVMARAAQALEQRGIEQIDLGVVDAETAAGLARFKLGTGARIEVLGGSWARFPRRRRAA